MRAALPATVPVLRPSWLPPRFRQATVSHMAANARGEGPVYWVIYHDMHGDALLFALGGANNATDMKIQRIRIRGTSGWLETSARGWPAIEIVWREQNRSFAVQARGVTRNELVHIVNALVPMPVSR